ncbi:hypothetical protein D3C72_1430590 [compost metagenome]
MIDARRGEPAALGQIGDAAVTAGFLVHRAGNLERPGQRQAGVDQGLDRDDGGGQAPLHVTGAPAINLAVLHLAAEGIDGPAGADLDHVDMAVEVDARPRFGPGPAGDDVGAGVGVAVARRAFSAHILDGEAALLQPLADVLGAGAIGLARRVDGGKADQVLGQGDQFVGAAVDQVHDRLQGGGAHRSDLTGTGRPTRPEPRRSSGWWRRGRRRLPQCRACGRPGPRRGAPRAPAGRPDRSGRRSGAGTGRRTGWSLWGWRRQAPQCQGPSRGSAHTARGCGRGFPAPTARPRAAGPATRSEPPPRPTGCRRTGCR